jgi:hypothetical protein
MSPSDARWALETTACRARTRTPLAVRIPVTRPAEHSTCDTGVSDTTRPPQDSICRTNAEASAPEPPRGVDQPKASRPAVSDDGRNPVPARRGSWMVAMASQSTNDRITGEVNRSCTTSQALRCRSARYRDAASPLPRSSPELHRPCTAASPPAHSVTMSRKACASRGDQRASSSTVASRSRCMTRRSPSDCGRTTAGSVCTYSRPCRASRPSSSFRRSGLDWISTCALAQESWAKPGRVSSSVMVFPPGAAPASRTSTSSPAAAR